MAIPATARRPAATEPTFFVAAPVKVDPGAPEPVFDGTTGVMGEPVAAAPGLDAAAPDPEGATPEPGAVAVPVAMGAVPVAKPVEPAIAVELEIRISGAQCQISS